MSWRSKQADICGKCKPRDSGKFPGKDGVGGGSGETWVGGRGALLKYQQGGGIFGRQDPSLSSCVHNAWEGVMPGSPKMGRKLP